MLLHDSRALCDEMQDVYTRIIDDNAQSSNEPAPTAVDPNLHREDEQVSVCLTPDSPIKRLKRNYLRLSSQATISHVKKYLAKKLFFDISRYGDVSADRLRFEWHSTLSATK